MNSRKAIVTDEHREEARRLRDIWDSTQHETQAVFGERYGIGNQSSVGQFLTGKVPLSMKAAQGFATGLKCDIKDFSPRIARQAEALLVALESARELVEGRIKKGQDPYEPKETLGATALVPVIGRDEEENLPIEIWRDGPVPNAATGEYALMGASEPFSFVAAVTGLSMIPRYQPSEYMLVEPRVRVRMEDDVLLRTSGRTMLRRLASDPSSEVLQLTAYSDASVLSVRRDDVVWMYHVAHSIPRRKIIKL